MIAIMRNTHQRRIPVSLVLTTLQQAISQVYHMSSCAYCTTRRQVAEMGNSLLQQVCECHTNSQAAAAVAKHASNLHTCWLSAQCTDVAFSICIVCACQHKAMSLVQPCAHSGVNECMSEAVINDG